jgi:hypothetical protein
VPLQEAAPGPTTANDAEIATKSLSTAASFSLREEKSQLGGRPELPLAETS